VTSLNHNSGKPPQFTLSLCHQPLALARIFFNFKYEDQPPRDEDDNATIDDAENVNWAIASPILSLADMR
jgi:hypothetical protein